MERLPPLYCVCIARTYFETASLAGFRVLGFVEASGDVLSINKHTHRSECCVRDAAVDTLYSQREPNCSHALASPSCDDWLGGVGICCRRAASALPTMSSPARALDAVDNAVHGAAAPLSVDALPKCDECDLRPATNQCSDPNCIALFARKLQHTLSLCDQLPGAGESRRQTGKQRRGQPHAQKQDGDALRQLTMHISTNDLHCCKPARLLQLAPSGGRPRRRPPATAPPRIVPPHQQRRTAMEDMTGRQQTVPPQQRRSKDATAHLNPGTPHLDRAQEVEVWLGEQKLDIVLDSLGGCETRRPRG